MGPSPAPPHRTARTDSPYAALLSASRHGLCDLSTRSAFGRGPVSDSIVSEEPEPFTEPRRTPPLPAEAATAPRPHQVTPKLTQRTALLGKLREVFRRHQSQPVGRVITEINPILRGWVNYFRIGNASRCLAYVRVWVEQRVRRHMMRARGRGGFGWKRWSTAWLHERLGLFGDYRVRYWAAPESAPGR